MNPVGNSKRALTCAGMAWLLHIAHKSCAPAGEEREAAVVLVVATLLLSLPALIQRLASTWQALPSDERSLIVRLCTHGRANLPFAIALTVGPRALPLHQSTSAKFSRTITVAVT